MDVELYSLRLPDCGWWCDLYIYCTVADANIPEASRTY